MALGRGFGIYRLGAVSGDVYDYAHLDGFAPGLTPGDRAAAGDLLGWVGATGNAETPRLHLGWIPDHGPRWVFLDGLADPCPLLVSVCG
jgi:murein DD-endopeptidase MepM/ murein hydrolase activator NlpD